MRRSRLLAAVFLVLGLSLPAALAQTPAPKLDPAGELRVLVAKIHGRLQAGADTAEALASELTELETFIAKHRTERPEAASLGLVTMITLHLQVFENAEAAQLLIRRLAVDFPHTEAGRDAARVTAQIERQNQAAAAQARLIGRAAPALDFTWASRAGLKSLDDLKGKVVVIDFWATWCGPCLDTFPQIADLVARYAGFDVEIVGVTSLQGRVANLEPRPIDCTGDPEKEKGLMPAFMQAKGMTWTVAFSEQEVMNPEYGVDGIPSMVILAPDGTVRHAGLHPAMPREEKIAMIEAILEEFGLRRPAKG